MPPPKKVTAEQWNLFAAGKMSGEDLLGDRFKPHPKLVRASPDNASNAKKSRRDEDDIQARAIAYMAERWPDLLVYGNATANIFFSGGLHKKALPKYAYTTLAAMGIAAKTWGHLIDHALQQLGINISVAKLEQEQKGAKFSQMNRTKKLGAIAAWPDIQVCRASIIKVHRGGAMLASSFNGLFIELKKPDASSLPWGKNGNGTMSVNDHLQSQAATLARLCEAGYVGVFAVGFDQFKAIIDIYMGDHDGDSYLRLANYTGTDGVVRSIYKLIEP